MPRAAYILPDDRVFIAESNLEANIGQGSDNRKSFGFQDETGPGKSRLFGARLRHASVAT